MTNYLTEKVSELGRVFSVARKGFAALVADSKVVWSEPSWGLAVDWFLIDPMSRPWYWVRFALFLLADIALMGGNLGSFWDNYIARHILIGVLPIQLILLAAGYVRFQYGLERYSRKRDEYLAMEGNSIETPGDTKKMVSTIEESWSLSTWDLVVNCVMFFVDYANLIATFYLMGTDPEELESLSIAFGYYSVIDMMLTLWGIFGDLLSRLTNNMPLKRFNMCLVFLFFTPVWVFSFLGYTILLGYFLRIEYTGGDIGGGFNVSDVEEIGDDLNNEFVAVFNQTTLGEALFNETTLPGTIASVAISVLYGIAFTVVGTVIICEFYCLPMSFRFPESNEKDEMVAPVSDDKDDMVVDEGTDRT